MHNLGFISWSQSKLEYSLGVGEEAQWLRTLAILPEDPAFIPQNNIVAYNPSYLQFWGTQCPLLASTSTRQVCVHRHTRKRNTHTHKRMYA